MVAGEGFEPSTFALLGGIGLSWYFVNQLFAMLANFETDVSKAQL